MKSEIKISGNRLQITRVFDAPRDTVFRWWSQAETLQQWSGCKDATRKASWNSSTGHTCPQEAETELGWTQGDHRGYKAALGGTPKGASQ